MSRAGVLTGRENFPGGIPTFASTLGYTRMVFFDHFNTINTINLTVGSTLPTWNWYQDPDNPANPSTYLSASNSILTMDGTNQPRVLSVGTGSSGSGFTYVGTVLAASGGIYFETRLQFTVPSSGIDFKPNFYMYDQQFFLNKLNGVSSFARHYAEIDLFEGRPATTNIQQVVHDWSSLAANTQTPASPSAFSSIDTSQYHTYGYLIIPMSANAGTGILRFYIDRVQSVSDITWTSSALNSCLECPGSGYSFYFAAGSTSSYNIDYVAAVTP